LALVLDGLAAWYATRVQKGLLPGQSGAVEIVFFPARAIRIATRSRASVSCPIESAAE